MLGCVGRGVECPKCHTVYFLDGGKNCDRTYYSAGSGQKRWKLLCICSEQVEFGKDEILTFESSKSALGRGRAVEGEWVKSRFSLNQFLHPTAVSRESSLVSILLAQFQGKKEQEV